MAAHIRVDIKYRKDYRIGALNKATPQTPTLCGAPATQWDFLIKDARRASAEDLEKFIVCRECLKKI